MIPGRRPATHILTVEVPLDLDGERDFDAVKDTIDLVLSVSRAAYTHALCDDASVTLEAVE